MDQEKALADELRRVARMRINERGGYRLAGYATLKLQRAAVATLIRIHPALTPPIRKALRKAVRLRVHDFCCWLDQGATIAVRRTALRAVADILDPGPSIEADTEAEGRTGPESDREEVVGTSTDATNANFSNTGFGGGSLARLVAA